MGLLNVLAGDLDWIWGWGWGWELELDVENWNWIYYSNPNSIYTMIEYLELFGSFDK